MNSKDTGLTKDQIARIISAVLTLLITLLSIFGYNVFVVKPQIGEIDKALTAITEYLAIEGRPPPVPYDQFTELTRKVDDLKNVVEKQVTFWGLTAAEIKTMKAAMIELTRVINAPLPEIAGGTSHFSNLSATDITATDDATLDQLVFPASTSFAVTNLISITPTATYMVITATAACSPLGIVAGDAGDILILTNESANAVTITDTGVIMLNTNRAIGQYDTLWLLSDGTNWLEMGFTNN